MRIRDVRASALLALDAANACIRRIRNWRRDSDRRGVGRFAMPNYWLIIDESGMFPTVSERECAGLFMPIERTCRRDLHGAFRRSKFVGQRYPDLVRKPLGECGERWSS